METSAKYTLGLFVVIIILIIFLAYRKGVHGVFLYYISKPRSITYYYRPSCPYCVKFMPIWNELVSKNKYKTNITFSKVNCTDSKYADACASQRALGMKGVPYIVKTTDNKQVVFEKTRTLKNLMDFVQK